MNDIHLKREPGVTAPAVVITGATDGIGRCLAEEFARGGHTLLLVARDESRLAMTRAELVRAHGIRVEITSQDLSTIEGCAGIELALRRFGLHADVLVNNAGIMGSGFFQDEELERVQRIVDLNIRAVVDLTLRFLPGMITRRHGGVLNIGSMMGFMPVPYEATYAASKAFLISFSKSLSYETMGTGVTVSVIMPGAVATDLHARAGTSNSYYLNVFPLMTPERVAEVAYRSFKNGRSVILPGFLNPLGAFAMRFVPDTLLLPLMGLLFRVRDEDGNPQGPGPLPPVGVEPRPAARRYSPNEPVSPGE
ncbi:MAG TPA: SDR family oxidoreductase [Methyloceanibacter sp.]